ncbi:E3 ubiquitin-protein ligase UBR1 [Eumeta japonica]|uniref:E3 ubiquitin-protein ligase n=1 Tax=Eumeta variegata TaxID=151549 RepID=A0A4C1XCA3_EUMVA|nr:E3 ubiquitin-protein ligase UBR1 [Eumeta japonica]
MHMVVELIFCYDDHDWVTSTGVHIHTYIHIYIVDLVLSPPRSGSRAYSRFHLDALMTGAGSTPDRFEVPARAAAVVELWREKMEAGLLSPTHFQEHWRVTVPRIFSPLPNRSILDYSYDEELAARLLIRPLEQFVWGGVAGEPPPPRRSRLCGRVFKQGEPAYSCRECGMDNTCVLCVECFKVSAHRHHKYKMGQSNGGGCCDCGDTEAWKRDPFCKLHAAAENEDEEETGIPQDVVERMKVVANVVLAYCFQLLTMDHAPGLPNELRLRDSERDPLKVLDQSDCYCTVVYNDETHTFDQVIQTLMRVMKSEHREAVKLVTLIDREGRALVKCNTFQNCDKLKMDIMSHLAMFERYTSRHGQSLKVLVMHAHVIAHQIFAMKLLNWIQTFVSQEPSLRLAVSQVALGEDTVTSTGAGGAVGSGVIVAGVMQNDSNMWKAARTAWHKLLIATTLMDYNTKKSLAILFTKNYASIMKDFVRDDHDHSFSISSLSVQLFTTPTLAHHLVAQHDALFVVLNTFVSECMRRINSKGRLEFDRNHVSVGFKRAQFVLYDVKYLLSSVPTTWDDDLRKGFLHGLSLILNLLVMMQGMDSVVRQVGQHMEYEPEWESAFNLHVKLAHSITLALEWCASDRTLTAKAYRMTLRGLHDIEQFDPLVVRELGSLSASVIPYSVASQPVSIHQPLSRFLAGLHLLLHKHGLNYHSKEFDYHDKPKPTPVELIEPVLRTATMVAQVHAGMWRRNGFSLLNQLYFYHNVKCRTEMLDRDVVMLQIGASLMESDEFIIHVLNKFNLLDWATPDFETKPIEDDYVRHTISMVEEFLGLLITVVGSRYMPGVGEVTSEDRTKKEIIQMLCVKPMPHSELNRCLPEDQLHETGLEAVINEVADFTKPSGSNHRGIYTLKKQLYDEYDTFFYHYTREELSRSEEAQRNRRKAAGLPECCPPPQLPRLTPPFRLLAHLLQCEAALLVLRTVFERALELRARCFSETQVHKALHLIGYAMRDEESGHYEFVAFAESAQRAGVLALLQRLAVSPRVDAHRPLVVWILNKMRSLLGESEEISDQNDKMDTDQSEKSSDIESADLEKQRRAKLAAERRAKLMAQMQAAQKSFITNNATLFRETDTETDADAEAEQPPRPTGVALGVWGGALPEPPRICILCQEEARVEAKSPPLVLMAFVQYSTVLNRQRAPGDGLVGGHNRTATLPTGVGPAPHVSSCGHALHAQCWRKYVENVAEKETRRPYRLRQPAPFDVEKKEYLCPLCERLCNTALPLLPAPPTPPIPPPPLSEEAFAHSTYLVLKHRVCSEVVHTCTELCEEMHCVARARSVGAMPDLDTYDVDDDGEPPLLMATHAEELVSTEFVQHFRGAVPTYNEATKTLIEDFSAMVPAVCGETSLAGAVASAALYRATSFTLLAAEAVLQAENRPLLGELPARHRDVLHALVRLTAALPAVWPAPTQIAHHALCALHSLERTTPTEHVTFATMVTAALAAPALFSRTASPARPDHLARQIALEAFRATITKALLVCDLDACKDYSMDEVEEDCSFHNSDLDGLLPLLGGIWKGRKQLDQVCPERVWSEVKRECHRFLRCSCLLFYFLSDVAPPPELTMPGRDTWDTMCAYLNLPTTFSALIGGSAARGKVLSWAMLSTRWFDGELEPILVREPPEPPRLTRLPDDFSELMNIISEYSCPYSKVREDSKSPTMCLVGGVRGGPENVGAAMYHAMRCGAGAGVFLRVRDCELLLLAPMSRGTLAPAPYLDTYGETDQGLRRGNPLRLCYERYEKLRLLWLSHGLHEKIARSLDANLLVNTLWQSM